MVYRIQDGSDSEDEVMEHNDNHEENVEENVEEIVEENVEIIQPEIEEDEMIANLVEIHGQETVESVRHLDAYSNDEIEESFNVVRDISRRYFSPEEIEIIPDLYQEFNGLSMTRLISQMFTLLEAVDEPVRRIVIMYMIFYIINKTLPRYLLSARVKIFTGMRAKIIQFREDEHSIDFEQFLIFGNPNLPSIEQVMESWVQ